MIVEAEQRVQGITPKCASVRVATVRAFSTRLERFRAAAGLETEIFCLATS
jgi:hypothetical protein